MSLSMNCTNASSIESNLEAMKFGNVYSEFSCPDSKQLSMNFICRSVTPFLFIIVFLFPLTTIAADLSSDKQALLDFANAIPHRRNLQWNPASSVCTSWVGILAIKIELVLFMSGSPELD
ncbi:hypothetical protein S83_034240 [Arachis hypogaea]